MSRSSAAGTRLEPSYRRTIRKFTDFAFETFRAALELDLEAEQVGLAAAEAEVVVSEPLVSRGHAARA